MIIKIEPNQATFIALEKRLTEVGQGSRLREVMKKSINETASVGRDMLYRKTREYYTIKGMRKSDIAKRSTSARNPGATLTVKGPPLGVRGNYQSRKNSRGQAASAMIIKAGAQKKLAFMSGGHPYKAFVATMKTGTGHEGIFQRVPGEYMEREHEKKWLATTSRPGTIKRNRHWEKIREKMSLSKAKAAEMVYVREGMYTDLQEELTYQLQKHINAVLGGS